MGDTKGIVLTAWMDFLNQRYGQASLAGAIKTLSPDDQALLSAPFLPSSWYPYNTLHALRRVTRALATPADQNLGVEIGRFMADHVFTGIYRSVFVHDPVKMIEKFSWVGDLFYQEVRDLDTEILSDTHVLVRHRHKSGSKPTRAICESLQGFYGRTLELAGALAVRHTHPKCLARADDCCEFVFEWVAKKDAAPAKP
jgi:hypothetical protein